MLPKPYWKQRGYKRPATALVNTVNVWELAAVRKLVDSGWKVYKKGWPDFMAVRGDEIRFIEVKPPARKHEQVHRLAPDQQAMADILKRFYAIQVELWNTYELLEVARPPSQLRANSVPKKRFKMGYGEHLVKHSNREALVKAGLIEPMGAGERVSGVTVESPGVKQENTLSLGRD